MDTSSGPSSTVQALLLQEAQQEIATLRTDLYNTRRIAEERRQALQALTNTRDQLTAQVAQLEGSLKDSTAQLQHLRGIDVQLKSLYDNHQKLQQEYELSIRARKILESELADERNQRRQAEEAKAALESERSRFQRSKDELAAQLRLAQRKVSEAEEEQLRAEEEAAALRAELSNIQGHLATGTAPLMEQAAAQPAQVAAATGPDHSELLEQVEYERNRAATLLSSLHAAKAELTSLHNQLRHFQSSDNELHKLKSEYSDLQSELEYSKSKIQFLETQLQQQEMLHHQQQRVNSHTSASSRRSSHADTTDHAHGHPHHSHTLHERAHHHAADGHVHGLAEHQLPAPADPEAQAQLEELTAEVDKLQQQVLKLKHSRDKLLEQIDKQWEELDRVGTDNKQLSEENKKLSSELQQAQRLAASWEAQAQDSLQNVDRLKDLLEESAGWSGAVAGAAAPDGTQQPGAVDGAAQAHLLLQEKAKSAELEVQLRALAAELVRAQHSNLTMGKSVLPILSGIEHRLGDMLYRAEAVQAVRANTMPTQQFQQLAL